jgi:hypothetical protein
MRSYLEGVRPQDKRWLRMKNAYESCMAAGVAVPQDVLDYFDFDSYEEEYITEEGPAEPLADGHKIHCDAITRHGEEMQDGFIVDLRKLDPAIKILRFVNSY